MANEMDELRTVCKANFWLMRGHGQNDRRATITHDWLSREVARDAGAHVGELSSDRVIRLYPMLTEQGGLEENDCSFENLEKIFALTRLKDRPNNQFASGVIDDVRCISSTSMSTKVSRRLFSM